MCSGRLASSTATWYVASATSGRISVIVCSYSSTRARREPAEPGQAEPPGYRDLVRAPGARVSREKPLRRQVQRDPPEPRELGLQLVSELAIGIQPGDLVLVLVRHDLEQVGGHGAGKLAGAVDLPVMTDRRIDQRAVPAGVLPVLVPLQDHGAVCHEGVGA